MFASYLDDEENRRGRVEGSIIQSDYSGAVSAEEIPHLETVPTRHIICGFIVYVKGKRIMENMKQTLNRYS